jgi:hypothetical protein
MSSIPGQDAELNQAKAASPENAIEMDGTEYVILIDVGAACFHHRAPALAAISERPDEFELTEWLDLFAVTTLEPDWRTRIFS